MDEQADEYTSDASWYGWLDQWHDDYPQPQDNNKKKGKRSKTKIGVFGIIIVVLLIGVSIAGWGSTLKTALAVRPLNLKAKLLPTRDISASKTAAFKRQENPFKAKTTSYTRLQMRDETPTPMEKRKP